MIIYISLHSDNGHSQIAIQRKFKLLAKFYSLISPPRSEQASAEKVPQPVLQTYRCIGTIRLKHLDESH